MTSFAILAAGLGTRMGKLTDDVPKCLVPVGGIPIICRILAALPANLASASEVAMVVGYRAGQIQTFVTTAFPNLPLRFLVNPKYARTGTIESLRLVLETLNPGQDVVLIEGDVVFEKRLFGRLLQERSEVEVATVLAPWLPNLSGTFAVVDDVSGLVTDCVHQSRQSSSFPYSRSYKTVNLTRLSAAAMPRFLRAIHGTMDEYGRTAPLEYAVQEFLRNGGRVAAIITRGERWVEVDTAEDLEQANRLFIRRDEEGSPSAASSA